MKTSSVKKKVEPYKKDNTYRNIKKGAIGASILVALGGSLGYKYIKNKETNKSDIKKTKK